MDRRSEVIWDLGAEPTLKLKYPSLTLITRSKLYRWKSGTGLPSAPISRDLRFADPLQDIDQVGVRIDA
jgi:hypothetical protein